MCVAYDLLQCQLHTSLNAMFSACVSRNLRRALPRVSYGGDDISRFHAASKWRHVALTHLQYRAYAVRCWFVFRVLHREIGVHHVVQLHASMKRSLVDCDATPQRRQRSDSWRECGPEAVRAEIHCMPVHLSTRGMPVHCDASKRATFIILAAAMLTRRAFRAVTA